MAHICAGRWKPVKHYETKEEATLSMHLLSCYLSEKQETHVGSINEDLRIAICDFLTKSFTVKEHKLYKHKFSNIMSMGNTNTVVHDAEHQVYKKHSQGIQPQHNVAESRKCIDKINLDKKQ